jgi:hypothetical protein
MPGELGYCCAIAGLLQLEMTIPLEFETDERRGAQCLGLIEFGERLF